MKGCSFGGCLQLPSWCIPSLFLTLLTNTQAQSDATTPQPEIREIRPGTFAIGRITLDKSARTVRIPATVNLRAGIVEYALVTSGGKIHESIFTTDTDPRHIHVAMLLLGTETSGKPLQETELSSNIAPDPLAPPVPGRPIALHVIRKGPHGNTRRPLHEHILAAQTGHPIENGPWTYNGSFIGNGIFAAQATGSIIALQHDPAALINNPRPGRLDDTYHLSNPKSLPPAGTPVTLVITLLP